MTDAQAQNSAGLITVAKAAALLMVSDQWVRDLGKKGYIPKPVGGMVPLVAAVQGYIRWLKDEERRTSKSAAASQVQQERALEIRMRREREAGNLIEMCTVETIFADVWGAFRSELAGVPAATTRDLSLRADIETRLNDALDRARGRFEKSSATLRAGRDLDMAGETPAS
jgi:hypothetical protein